MVKRISIVLLIILGVFISFSLYRTYAYNTTVVEETPSTTDLEYTFKIGDSSIKEITIISGETKYYDIVLGNHNNAKISYSIYYEMVNPNTKPDGFSIEYTSKSTGDSTGKVDKKGNITLNLVVTNTSSSSVTVKLGSIAGYVNGGELTLGSGQVVIPKKVTAADFINSLDDGTTGDSGSGVYKIEHDAIPAENSATGSEIPAVTDYRYYGTNPNNYICLDNSSGTCEDRHLYRIIGSIYEELSGQNLLKVIKATPLTDGTTSEFSWDCKGSNSNVKLLAKEPDDGCSDSSTIWYSTTEDSSLMQLLNGIWFMRSKINYYNNSSTTITVNFAGYGPSDKAQSLINNNSRYYLGSYSNNGTTTPDIYLVERGTNINWGDAKYWDGKIGLMYPSDVGYASGRTCSMNSYSLIDCPNKSWLHKNNQEEWLITGDSRIAFCLIKNGLSSDFPFYTKAVRPTFYLSKDVVITGGTGTETDPYTLSVR